MSESNSITSGADSKPPKPSKPYTEFPLFPHAAKQWAKKIRGKLHYFGPWSDPDGALDKYEKDKDALHAGRKPRPDADTLTVKELANEFLNFKQALVDAGELTYRSKEDYKAACVIIVDYFSKTRTVADIGPDDFVVLRKKLAKKWGPTTLGNVINRIRVVFKFAFDNRLIDRPVCYGQAFKRPSKKTLRIDRAKKSPKLFTAEEINTLMKAAPAHMRAMILLGINAGLGNHDVGSLSSSVVNLESGWLDFPRPKTGIPRRAKLWAETVAAIREALATRPEPKSAEYAGLVFITKYGLPWSKDTADQTLAKEMGKLLRKLYINGRKGLGFYTLRHTFRTVADEEASHDQPAIDLVMGHESPHISTAYRETISNERLEAVANAVRAWLFADKEAVKK